MRKGRPVQIIDALMSDRYNNWTKNRDFLLGAHLMNDPSFKYPSTIKDKINLTDGSSEGIDSHSSDSDKSVEMPNCVIRPLI